MPWYFPWSDSIKKRACRYLLQHYLGQFLQEKLTLDQLSVDLYNGTGTIRNLNLDVWALNELLENSHVPVEIVDGYVSKINVGIPWSALNNDSTTMEIHGLELTLQPKERAPEAPGPVDPSIMLDSWSMTTSLQLAQECLKQEPSEGEQQAEGAQPFEGLEMFAQTIESVLSRIKVSFIDTVVRIEHLPKECKSGVALEMRIKRIDYFDDQVTDQGTSIDKGSANTRSIYEPAAVQNKNFRVMGVTFYCDQFPESNRTFSRSTSTSTSFDSSSPLSPKTSQPILTQPNIGSAQPTAGMSQSSTTLSETIKIAELAGQQEIKIKLKQSEALPGPKLEVNCNLMALKVLLSPKQVHILLQLVSGLSSPGTCDNTNIKPRSASDKPMQADDYRKVEQDLQTQLQNTHVQYRQPTSLKQQMWRDDPLGMLGESLEDEEIYYSMGLGGHGSTDMDASISSQHSSSSIRSTSTVGSSCYQYSYGAGYRSKPESPFKATIPRAAMVRKPGRLKSKDHLQKLLDDPAAELTRYKLKLTYFSLTILHEDPPPTPSDGIDPGVSSVEKLKTISEKFFDELRLVPDRSALFDLEQLREKYAGACPHDHINCVGKPLNVECNQKSSSAFLTMSAAFSIGMLEIIETLFDRRNFTSSSPLGFSLPVDASTPYYSELLVFLRDICETHEYPSLQAVPSPCIKIKINNYEKNRAVVSRPSSQLPRTEVHLELGWLKSEIDCTIIDRIHSLLNPEPLVKSNDNNGARYWSIHPNVNVNKQSYFSNAMEEGNSTVDRKVDVHITSPQATLLIRFPIPDLRQGQLGDKYPWWKRTLRTEMLIIELSDTDLHTCYNTSDLQHTVELTTRELHGLFQEQPNEPPISFIRVSQGSDESPTGDNQDGFDWPRIVFKTMPRHQSSLMEQDPDSDEMPQQDSMDGFCQFSKVDPSPFSNKKHHYENEEMVMPGDRQEMNDFQEKSAANTLKSLEITAPNVNVLLPSKEFYELIYNRINGDLLMWEAQAPSPITTQDQLAYSMPGVGLDPYLDYGHERFDMCRSGYPGDSSSDSEESNGQFYTIHDQKERQKRIKHQTLQLRPSKLCLTLTIGQGKLTACMPVKDEGGEVIKDMCGELVMEVGDCEVFCVVGHSGNPDLQYLCIHSNKAQIFHAGWLPMPTAWPMIERACPVMSRRTDLQPTLYRSEPGVCTKLSGAVGSGGDSLDMLSVAVKITLDTFSNVKEFLVAVGVRGATLQHRFTPSDKSWLHQVLDFLDVKDYPILGYTMPKVVTVLHAHFWSCAIDYRPMYIPLRSMVTVEHFSISSNIIAGSDTSLLRFMVDDAALFLSDKVKNGVDLKKNYVCVLDVGLFELSLITSDGKDTKYPKIDLKASNNIIHIRTCADSCRALQQLIQYVASDSDLAHKDDTQDKSIPPEVPPLSKPPESLRSVPMTESKMEEVHDMMVDAMRESSGSSSPESQEKARQRRDSATEVFFFPDDNRPATSGQPAPHHINVVMEESHESVSSSTITNETDMYSDDEEEFCIIDDPGLGIIPRDGEPVIRVLVDEPLVIKDDHFARPLGRADQLKAPESFPAAVYRYTLKEMSLVWHMYGGSDLAPGSHEKKDKKISMYGTRVSYGKATKESKSAKIPWQHRGGPGRDHKVLMELQMNKVRLQHEVYPETTEQASRQIFLVHEIEIRDRLATSQINKFLYHYTSESMPRQSHAHMVMAKALHVRSNLNVPSQKECSLKVSILPLRLNVDQDSLFFLKDFFNKVSVGESKLHADIPNPVPADVVSTSPAKPSSLPPVMSLGSSSPEMTHVDPQQMLIVFDELAEAAEDKEAELDAEDADASPLPPVFFKSFVFSPDVLIRLDYQGKRVDMGQGTAAGLLIGLAQLNCSELKLKRICHKHGLLGVDRLMLHAVNEWINDITKNQIPNILSGVGPMHSFVQLVQGIRDLFWLPVEQYRKDGRIFRGIQRGANSFGTSTVMATLELTNRMVQSVQYVAELTYDMVSPGPSCKKLGRKSYRRHKRMNQPSDFREGIANAYTVVKEGISGTADNIVRVAQEEHEHKGMTGAVGGVLRQIPPTIVQPFILASEATANVLGGMRNQLLPDARREEEEKWKPDS
ncbi:autophagy-related protein 2 homolog B-like isoform X2 [Lineus longissimus]|uniref:autophagy-related protein 2 homolog B-like isoform X2 n=1 Tax=Lineus longissimus TaxID=88925 RepID=UPI002B4E8444